MNKGYRVFFDSGHPHATSNGRVYEHIDIAMRALGRPIPEGVEVHHVNGDRADNSRGNLVICENREYHHLLHVRTRAIAESGHANYRRCSICKTWDDPARLKENPHARTWHHPLCRRDFSREWARKRYGYVSVHKRKAR